jgi:hypothetical protein
MTILSEDLKGLRNIENRSKALSSNIPVKSDKNIISDIAKDEMVRIIIFKMLGLRGLILVLPIWQPNRISI